MGLSDRVLSANRGSAATTERKYTRYPESRQEKLDRKSKSPFFLKKDGSNKYGNVLKSQMDLRK